MRSNASDRNRVTGEPTAPDDYDDADPAPEALSGSATPITSTELSSLLLELISAVARLRVLVDEADSAELRAVARRLGALKSAVRGLRYVAPGGSALGFSRTEESE